jgi:tetratricopeptide (TPR) repeat protein
MLEREHGTSSEQAGKVEMTSKKRKRMSAGKVDGYLLYTVLAALAAVLGLVVWIVVAGLFRPQAPRTSIERDIYSSEAAIKATPKNEKAWIGYVNALMAGGRYSEAQAALVKAQAAVGKLPGLAVASGQLLFAEGDITGALKKADDGIALALKLREVKVAEVLSKGSTPDPHAYYSQEIVDACLLATDVLTKQGLYSKGIEYLTNALSESPQMADVLTIRGDLYAKTGATDKARADYEQALKYGPDYAPAVNGLKGLQEVGK